MLCSLNVAFANVSVVHACIVRALTNIALAASSAEQDLWAIATSARMGKIQSTSPRKHCYVHRVITMEEPFSTDLHQSL
jgi:hypothetical protein